MRAAMLDAVPAWTRIGEELATTVAVAGVGAIDTWAQQVREDPEIVASLYRTRLLADLGGQLFVRLVEVPESVPTRALADDVAPFLRLPFDEAIAQFLARRIITPEEFRTLSDLARGDAFTASRLATESLRQRAFAALARTLEDGGTVDDFIRDLRDGSISLGITPSDSAYLETVYRTNVQGAYGAGRYRQLTSPVVAAARPYVEYRTAGDSRVRPSHAALNGVIFRQDDPGWGRFAPPGGYNCRCTVIARSEEDVRGRRVTVAAAIGPDALPDPGFDAPPTARV